MGITEIVALAFFVSMTLFAVGARDWIPSYAERQARKCERRIEKLKAYDDRAAYLGRKPDPELFRRIQQIEEEAAQWRNNDPS